MKALAGFIVRGRPQAILIAALSGMAAFLLPPVSTLTNYLGAAVVGLVTLHINPLQGLLVLGAAALLTVLFYQFAGVPALAVAATVLVLWVPCWLISVVLRHTVSLASAMRFAAALGVCALLLVYGLYGDPAPWWFERLQQLASALEEANLFPGGLPADEPLLEGLSRLLTGVVLASLMLGAVCSVMLARWWQSLLVNPGGLHREFCELRLGQATGVLTLGVMLLGQFTEGAVSDLGAQAAMIMLVPYLLAGLAVMHALVASTGRGRGWLIAVYVMLMILPQALLVLAGAGLLDTWIDFRRRFGGGGTDTE